MTFMWTEMSVQITYWLFCSHEPWILMSLQYTWRVIWGRNFTDFDIKDEAKETWYWFTSFKKATKCRKSKGFVNFLFYKRDHPQIQASRQIAKDSSVARSKSKYRFPFCKPEIHGGDPLLKKKPLSHDFSNFLT